MNSFNHNFPNGTPILQISKLKLSNWPEVIQLVSCNITQVVCFLSLLNVVLLSPGCPLALPEGLGSFPYSSCAGFCSGESSQLNSPRWEKQCAASLSSPALVFPGTLCSSPASRGTGPTPRSPPSQHLLSPRREPIGVRLHKCSEEWEQISG